jgi:cation:H+ antiporter
VGLGQPWFFILLFLLASIVMVWRLESMSENGLEGTVLGTLITPYCSGLGNLVFVFLMARTGSGSGSGTDVMTNCLVNNVTNLTLVIGLPAVLWPMVIVPGRTGKRKKGPTDDHQINRLSLLLTLLAVLFFTGATWALALDGKIDFADGLVLVGLFAFWQVFHVFEVMKSNVREHRSFGFMFIFDVAVLMVGAYGVYLSIDWLVAWLSTVKTGFVSAKQIGWLSGWLMVLPNALLALYYGWRKRADVIYSSQVGDSHICIPLCVGLFALIQPIAIPQFFQTGAILLGGAAVVHGLFLMLGGRIPRWFGLILIGAYVFFVYQGLIG